MVVLISAFVTSVKIGLMCWTITDIGVRIHRTIYSGRARVRACEWAELASRRPVIATDVAKDAFQSTAMFQARLVEGHGHPTAAAHRSRAEATIRQMALSMGISVYSVSRSKSDERKGIRGNRGHWWAKDLNAHTVWDELTEQELLMYIDVDYYVDMPQKLCDHPNVTVLYTVVPEQASCAGVDDTTFRFLEDGKLDSQVAGGGRYVHHLWNYASDSLVVTKTFLGIPYRKVFYAVERRQVAKHRQLIMLAPLRVCEGIFSSILNGLLIEGPELTRFNPIEQTEDGPFVRFEIQTTNGVMKTTARPGQLLCATVPAATDEAIAGAARMGKGNIQVCTAQSWIKPERIETGKPETEADKATAMINAKMAANMLAQYHRAACPKNRIPVVFPAELGVREYQFRPSGIVQGESRAKLEPFMSPLVNEAFAPTFDKASEEACVEGRINKLKKSEPKPCTFRLNCMEDFVRQIVHGADLHPWDHEDVASKQTRASQKASLERAYIGGPFTKNVLKCFIKAEAYSGLKDPRNISTFEDQQKLEMGRFTNAAAAHMKQYAWYGPGKTPVEIAQRVAEICESAAFVNISDFHRMDGTISYELRKIDTALMMGLFPGHRAQVNELLRKTAGNVGFLPLGTTFQQGSSQGSGCSGTSLFQTVRAAFCAYLAYRNTVSADGTKLSHTAAFAKLGIHFGDDGLDPDLPIANHTWSADRVGLILEGHIVPRGERGVEFLARVYSPYVWSGSLDSMCAVRRQLSKFHTTVRCAAGIKPERKLVEKAMGYAATDANTPVIGELALAAVARAPKGRDQTPLGVSGWWAQFDSSVQFPNENVGGWMDAQFKLDLPQFDRDLFERWLRSTVSLGDLLSPPLCQDIEPVKPASVEAAVDGIIVPAIAPPEPVPTSLRAEKKARRRVRTRKQTETSQNESVPGRRDGKSPQVSAKSD